MSNVTWGHFSSSHAALTRRRGSCQVQTSPRWCVPSKYTGWQLFIGQRGGRRCEGLAAAPSDVRLRTVLADRPKERRVNLVPAARLHAGVEEGHGDDDLEDGA